MPPELKIDLISAFVNWSDKNNLVTYVQVVIDDAVAVPSKFIENGKIILNISSQAIHNFHLANNALNFSARFDGTIHEIFIPVERIGAIFVKDSNIGLGLPIDKSPIITQDAKVKRFRKISSAVKKSSKKTIGKMKPNKTQKIAQPNINKKSKNQEFEDKSRTVYQDQNKTLNKKQPKFTKVE